MDTYQQMSEALKTAVDLTCEAVGIKFYKTPPVNKFSEVKDHRFCQFIMRARKGETIILTKDGITCPAAAAALGFKPLPKKLQDGSMLQGYGIFKESVAAINAMNQMPRLVQDEYTAVAAGPLSKWQEMPDVTVIEDEVEKLMWIALAYLNKESGRLDFSTSILQAMCVDATVLPFKSGKINMSFGCYGCRDVTDAKPNEAILGIPSSKLDMTVEHLNYLKSKAIDRSREKKVFQSFNSRTTQR